MYGTRGIAPHFMPLDSLLLSQNFLGKVFLITIMTTQFLSDITSVIFRKSAFAVITVLSDSLPYVYFLKIQIVIRIFKEFHMHPFFTVLFRS